MRAAFYECDITPPLGCNMPGYYRANPAMNVFERLYAKAVVVEDEGNYAVIIAIDTCEVNPMFTEVITKRIKEYTGIDPKDVCIHVVHTHKGAPTEHRPEVGQNYDAAYTDVCMRLAADAAILAYQRLDTAEAKFGVGSVEGIAFNRNYIVEGGEMVSFGPGGKKVIGMLAGVDTQLPVMTFERDGKPIGALISFACHQDCTGREVNGYSADYSSILSKELKKIYGEDFVSLFMIGTCGDINDLDTDPTHERYPFQYRDYGKKMAKEAVRVMAESKPVGGGISVVKEEITLKLRQSDAEYVDQKTRKWLTAYAGMMRLRNLIYYHTTNKMTEDTLWLQVMRIGNTCIYVYPGEIYVNFGLRIKESSKFQNNFVIENSNSFGGYIPTPEAFAPENDLYETSLCEGSRHVPEAGDQMTDRLLEMAEKLQ